MEPSLIAHFSLLALMVLLCLAAAVVANRKRGEWLCRHRLLGSMGAISGLIGIAIMVSEKIEHGWPHFHSPHALIGLAVGILLVVVPVLGLLASRGANSLRPLHRFLARALLVVALAAVVAGILRHLQLEAMAKPAATQPPAGKS